MRTFLLHTVHRLFAFAFFCMLAVSCARAEVKIAIFGTQENSHVAVDLLTATLSQVPSLALVERQELDRVLKEQGAAARSIDDFARISKTLRADGMLLLSVIDSGNGQRLALRFVVVDSGVILHGAAFPFPLKDPAEWAKLVSNQVVPLLPKLSVPADRAVPISLINLRFPASTPAAIRLEQSLSALLFHRLMAEKEIFVLERRQMGSLAWEKAQDSSSAKSFWAGAYLLEGIIDRDGAAPKTMTLHARLSKPGDQQAIELEVSAPRNDPSALVETLAIRILSALRREPAARAWDPLAEAARFAEEARWAARWGVWAESYVAADSAYSLGLATEEVAAMKIVGLQEQSHTPVISHWNPGTRTMIINESLGLWVFDPLRNVGWSERPPEPGSVERITQALEFYSAHCLTSDRALWLTNEHWFQSGRNVLSVGSEVLRHCYFHGWRTGEFDPDLPQLRRAARDVFAILASAAPIGPDYSVSESVAATERTRATNLLHQAILEGALWQESPGDAIRIHRQTLTNGVFGLHRKNLIGRDWKNPFWVGWSAPQRAEGMRQWTALLAELSSSTNRAVKADAALLKLRDAVFDADIAAATEAFYDAAMEPDRNRFSREVDYTAVDLFSTLIEAKGTQTLRRGRLLREWQLLSFRRLIHYFQTVSVHDVDRGGWPIANALYTPAQAKELLPVVQEYARRFPKGDWIGSVQKHLEDLVKEEPSDFVDFFTTPFHDPARFEELFLKREVTQVEARKWHGTLRGYVGKRGWIPEEKSAVDRFEKIANNAPQQPAPAFTNALAFDVSRFYSARFTLPGSPTEIQGPFLFLKQREGRWFAAVPYFQPDSCAAIVEMNIRSGGCTVLFPGVPHDVHGPVSYDVLDGVIYWIQDQNTVMYARPGGKPQAIHVELPVNLTRLCAVGKRIYLASQHFIAELLPDESSVRLLAGTRRKPAVTKLDSWQWTGIPDLDLTQDGSLTAVFTINEHHRVFWTLNSKSSDWDQALEISEARLRFDGAGPGRFLHYSKSISTCKDQLIAVGAVPRLLLSDDPEALPEWPMPFDFPQSPGFEHGNYASHLFDGTNLWLLTDGRIFKREQNRISFQKASERDGTLCWFDPLWEIPREIPLKFAPGKPAPAAGRSVLHADSDGLLMSATPMINPDTGSGFWFLPWEELRAWVQQHQPDSRNLPRRAPELQRRAEQAVRAQGKTNDFASALRMELDKPEEHAFHARRLLLTYDRDGDGRLNKEESTLLLQSTNLRPKTPLPRGHDRFHYFDASWLNLYDRNADASLNAEEVLALYTSFAVRKTASPADRMRPGFPMSRPGMPPFQPGFPRGPTNTSRK